MLEGEVLKIIDRSTVSVVVIESKNADNEP